MRMRHDRGLVGGGHHLVALDNDGPLGPPAIWFRGGGTLGGCSRTRIMSL